MVWMIYSNNELQSRTESPEPPRDHITDRKWACKMCRNGSYNLDGAFHLLALMHSHQPATIHWIGSYFKLDDRPSILKAAVGRILAEIKSRQYSITSSTSILGINEALLLINLLLARKFKTPQTMTATTTRTETTNGSGKWSASAYCLIIPLALNPSDEL